MADYSELRRLLTGYDLDELGRQIERCRDNYWMSTSEHALGLVTLAGALPELLDEVSTLTSKLALANRALDEANQSITELHQRLAMAETAMGIQHKRINQDAERIAQLEAALREIDTELDAWGDERLRARKEAVRKIARSALASIPVCAGCGWVKADCKCPQSTAT